MFIKTKKWLIIIIAMFTLVTLVGCNSDLPTGVTVEGKATLTVGEEATFTFELTPAEAVSTVKWSSDNESVLKVDNGKVTAVGVGKANIIVTCDAATDITGKIEVTVEAVKPTAIDIIGGQLLLVGDEEEFFAEFTPADTTDQGVTWTSSDPTVVEIDENGKAECLTPGMATITATSTADTTIKKDLEVKVVSKESAPGICISARNYILENMPIYIDSDFDFPVYNDPFITVTYTMGYTTFKNGKFVMPAIDNDQRVAMKIDIAYDDGSKSFELKGVDTSLQLVLDAEDNDFLRMDKAEVELDAYFEKYVRENNPEEVTTDLVFPKSIETDLGIVYLKWTSDNANVITTNGVYTRPDNRSKVLLDVVYEVRDEPKSDEDGNEIEGVVLNSDVSHYTVFAHGYTTEEKIEYIKENDLQQYLQETPFSTIGHTRLAERDSKFGVKFTWESSDVTFLNNEGKLLLADFDTERPITYKLTLTYGVEYNEFEEELDIIVVVKPFTNDAEAAAFSLSNHEAALLATHFPYGKTEDNKITLPTTIAEFADATITWSSTSTLDRQNIAWVSTGTPNDATNVAGSDPVWEVVDNEATLLVQPLRYTESKLIATVTVGENTATYEHVVNVGIAEKSNTNYIALTRSYSAATGQATQLHDFLSQLGAWDFPYSTQTGYSYGYMKTAYISSITKHSFSGLTYYWDDVNTGIRHQMFAAGDYVIEIDGAYTAEEEAAGTAPFAQGNTIVEEGFARLGRNIHIDNWGLLYRNNSEEDVKLPIAYTGIIIPTADSYYDKKGNIAGRENYVSMDGYRYGAIYDADGNCVFANCEMQDYKTDDAGALILDEEGNKQINYKLDASGEKIAVKDADGNEVKDENGNTVYEIEKCLAVYASIEAYLKAHCEDWQVYQLDETTRIYKQFNGKYYEMKLVAEVWTATNTEYTGELPTTVATVTDDEGNVSNVYKYPSYVIIPAGGHCFAVKTQNNTEQTNYIPICTIGNKMTFETYTAHEQN